MSIFIVETYVVKSEQRDAFLSAVRRILTYKQEHPEKFQEMKSKRIFSQLFGGIVGGFIEMNEFDSLADAEQYMSRVFQDDEFIKLYHAAKLHLVPATYSLNVWKTIE